VAASAQIANGTSLASASDQRTTIKATGSAGGRVRKEFAVASSTGEAGGF
jgi:hypothetical protein